MSLINLQPEADYSLLELDLLIQPGGIMEDEAKKLLDNPEIRKAYLGEA